MAFQPFDREAERTGYVRHLPHWRQGGCTYFATFRLGDSIPMARRDEWLRERAQWLRLRGLQSIDELGRLPLEQRRIFQRTFTRKMHEMLDAGYGSCLFRDPHLAEVVANALRFFDGERTALGDFVVMPNHAHALVTPIENWPLEKWSQSVKRFSAREVNRVRGVQGPLWQEESFDHIVRSEAQLAFFREYIRENPVKAGLHPGEYVLGCGSDRGPDLQSGS
ncbi:MAG TPA: transposase [Chthoniobacteraceae bacterium]|nr:transposase [Chthoniobacteraceae bacterium]